MLKPGIDALKERLSRVMGELQVLHHELGEWETEDVHVTPPSNDKTIKAEVVKSLVELLQAVGQMTESSVGYRILREVGHGPIPYVGPHRLIIEITYNEQELRRKRATGALREGS